MGGRHKPGVLRTLLITMLSPLQPLLPLAIYFTLWLVWHGPMPLLDASRRYPLRDEDARGWFLEEKFIVRMRSHSLQTT
jgi:hypothetical protein